MYWGSELWLERGSLSTESSAERPPAAQVPQHLYKINNRCPLVLAIYITLLCCYIHLYYITGSYCSQWIVAILISW